MKNISTRSILFAFLIFFSLSSYVYINSLKKAPTVEVQTMNQNEKEEAEQQQEQLLPDVQIVKSLLQRSKGLLPAS